MTTHETLRSILSKKSGAHLGDVVYWSLSDAEVSRPELEAVWAKAGLPAELLPEAPTVEKAYKIAARETAVGLTGKLIRLAKEDEVEVLFGVVREERLPDGTLLYTQEARIGLDKATGVIQSDAPTHEVVAGITARFHTHRDTHTPDDLRRTINRTLASFSACLLRHGGGVWYVPAPHAKGLKALQTAVESIGQSRFWLLPIMDGADATRTLGDAAAKSIEEELEQLKTEVAGFLQAPPERPSTLVRRFDAFESLRARAGMYRDILSVQVKDLDCTLSQLTEAVEGLLNQRSAA